jgi:hypothetical protein
MDNIALNHISTFVIGKIDSSEFEKLEPGVVKELPSFLALDESRRYFGVFPVLHDHRWLDHLLSEIEQGLHEERMKISLSKLFPSLQGSKKWKRGRHGTPFWMSGKWAWLTGFVAIGGWIAAGVIYLRLRSGLGKEE